MGKKDTPDPPDYRGAAEEQAAASAENLMSQNYANRPTQVTPWGTSSWQTSSQIDPSTGQRVTGWQQNIELDPRSQQALDSQMGLQQRRSDLAGGMYDRVANEFGPTMDFSQFDDPGGRVEAGNYSTEGLMPFGNMNPDGLRDYGSLDTQGLEDFGRLDSQGLPSYGDLNTEGLSNVTDPSQLRQQAEDSVYNRFTSRLDPQFEQRSEALESRLRNQGLRPGDEAYDMAMENFGRERTDAYQTAAYDANTAGRAEAGQLFGQQLGLRGQQFGERGAVAGFDNSVRAQNFGERTAIDADADQRRAQQFGERGTVAGFDNTTRGQQFGELDRTASFDNRSREQQMAEMLRTGGQQFGEQIQASGFNTQNRQQQIAEEMQRRGFSLNEINALLTGQQVGMPNMPDFNASGRSETPQYMNAANSQYNAELDAYNSQQAAYQGLMSGAGSLGSAFFPMGFQGT